MPKTTRHSERPGRPLFSAARDARAQLLAAATALFAEHGIAATSFSTIAKRAGLTPAMMHYYFKDRDELLDAVVLERLVPFIACVWAPVEPGNDPIQMVGGVVQRLLNGIEKAPWIPNTWMREILNESGLLRTRVLRHLPVDKVRLVGEAIRTGQTNNALNRQLDPLLYVFSAIGLVMLHMATLRLWSEIFHRPRLGVDDMQRHITALLMDGLRHPSPAAVSQERTKRASRSNK
jgi:TetR/AcrR family transcriptional regulator